MEPGKQQENIVKLAVEPPKFEGNSAMMPSFLHFNQARKLEDIIQDLCKGWSIPNPQVYSLQNAVSKLFIDEQNRHTIIDGTVLRLGKSPAVLAREIYENIKSGVSETAKPALAKLASMAEDEIFAREFIKLDGLQTLLYMVEGGTDLSSSELRAHILTAFQELMDHGIITWDLITNVFVKKLCGFVSTTALTDPTVLKRSLSILESIVQNSPNFYTVIVKDVTIDSLLHHLQNVSPDVKINTISLINAIIMKTPQDHRKHLYSEILSVGVRNVLLTNIIRNPKGMSDEMAHQLYTYQVLTFSFLESRMNSPMKEDDQTEKEKIESLRKTAIESNYVQDVQLRTTKDYRKLGFEHPIKLSENFREVPPGILPLDCMTYLSKQYPDTYLKVVLENMGRGDGHVCPFGKSSIALVKLLCRLLKIGELPDDSSSEYYPIFFTTEYPFQELYCICIQLLGKTWREMRAKSEDFGRVMGVVEKQIKETLKEKSPTLDVFKQYLYNLKVDKIIDNMIQGSASGINIQSKPVADLRERIVPDLILLVQNQRLHQLIDGTMFEKHNYRKTRRDEKTDRYWYCRLSQNRRFLHHGNCDENTVPSADALPNKIALSDVDELKTGAECPHMIETKKKSGIPLAFSLILKDKEPLNFVAPNKDKFELWVDTLKVLLGQQAIADSWNNDLNNLIEMEMKLRLLDLDDVKIPEEQPPIPPDPPGYEFRYNFN